MPNHQEHTKQLVLRKALRLIARTFPMVMAVLLLAALLEAWLESGPPGWVADEDGILSVIAAGVFGSVAAGHPMTSYVLGGELLRSGASEMAATALIVSWVTVGAVQLPAEAASLGWRFALVRNGLSFLAVFAVAALVFMTVKAIGLW